MVQQDQEKAYPHEKLKKIYGEFTNNSVMDSYGKMRKEVYY